MIKIAVSTEDGSVSGHFGGTKSFTIYETENQNIISEQTIPNPGHKPGFLPNFLNDMGVKVIISGGMGKGAIDIFEEKNIDVIIGAQGNATTAVEQYLNGDLKSTGSVCQNHDHHGHHH